MGLLLLILVLEVSPMVILIKWRRGLTPDPTRARVLSAVSYVEAWIVVAMVFVAAALARGYAARV
jgi:putative membrane protein